MVFRCVVHCSEGGNPLETVANGKWTPGQVPELDFPVPQALLDLVAGLTVSPSNQGGTRNMKIGSSNYQFSWELPLEV
jgi:hypothetical protein